MEKNLYTVLSIDGGGIRGIIPVRVLAELERRLGRPLTDALDLAAGTSTGGIIAAGLTLPDPNDRTKPKYRASDIEQFYLKEGAGIFHRRPFNRLISLFRPKYDNTALKHTLKNFFGDKRLDDAMTSIMLPAYDIERRESVFMRHLKLRTDDHWERRWKTADAVLASASAPTYFPPVRARSHSVTPGGTPEDPAVIEHTLVDGGIFANNPAMAAYINAMKEKPADAEVFMISLGTGHATRKFPYEHARNWGALEWINPNKDTPVISASMDGQSSGADLQMEFSLGDQYIRLDTPLRDPDNLKESPNDAFDDASPKNLRRLQRTADRLIRDNSEQLDRIVDILRIRAQQKDLQKTLRDTPRQPLVAERRVTTKPSSREGSLNRFINWLRERTWSGQLIDTRNLPDHSAEQDNQPHPNARLGPATSHSARKPAAMTTTDILPIMERKRRGHGNKSQQPERRKDEELIVVSMDELQQYRRRRALKGKDEHALPAAAVAAGGQRVEPPVTRRQMTP